MTIIIDAIAGLAYLFHKFRKQRQVYFPVIDLITTPENAIKILAGQQREMDGLFLREISIAGGPAHLPSVSDRPV